MPIICEHATIHSNSNGPISSYFKLMSSIVAYSYILQEIKAGILSDGGSSPVNKSWEEYPRNSKDSARCKYDEQLIDDGDGEGYEDTSG